MSARRKSKVFPHVYAIVIAAVIGGVAIGAALAVVADPLIRDICDSAPRCQRVLSALIGGFALMQAFHIAIVYLLMDRLNRQSEERILSALSER